MFRGKGKFFWLLAAGLTLLTATAWATPQVTLAWDASASPTVTGYRLYYGASSREYTNIVDVGDLTTATISNLVESTTYFFSVTAYDIAGLESDFSTEISYTVPAPPAGRLQIVQQDPYLVLTASGTAGSIYNVLTSTDLVNWEQLTDLIIDDTGTSQFVVLADPSEAQRFFQLQPPPPP